MKTRPHILALACLSGALLFTGCASRTIEASSTKLKASNPLTGSAIEFALPKNLDAENLVVTIDPATKKFELRADKLKSDASTVIETAGIAQAQALASMSGAMNNLTSMLQQWIAQQIPPAASPPPAPASPPAAAGN